MYGRTWSGQINTLRVHAAIPEYNKGSVNNKIQHDNDVRVADLADECLL